MTMAHQAIFSSCNEPSAPNKSIKRRKLSSGNMHITCPNRYWTLNTKIKEPKIPSQIINNRTLFPSHHNNLKISAIEAAQPRPLKAQQNIPKQAKETSTSSMKHFRNHLQACLIYGFPCQFIALTFYAAKVWGFIFSSWLTECCTTVNLYFLLQV